MKTPMVDEFQKIAAAGGLTFVVKLGNELTSESRSDVPKKDFAVSAKKSNTGKPAYPIEDRQHAISALGFAKMHHDKADIAEVKKDVAAKYPDLVHKAASVLGPTLNAIYKHACDSAMPKKGKEKDGNMGMGTYGPASSPPPGMMGGPAPGHAMKATMSAGM